VVFNRSVSKTSLLFVLPEGSEAQLSGMLNDRVTPGSQIKVCLSGIVNPDLVALEPQLTVGQVMDKGRASHTAKVELRVG
jgi:hypothetical protein